MRQLIKSKLLKLNQLYHSVILLLNLLGHETSSLGTLNTKVPIHQICQNSDQSLKCRGGSLGGYTFQEKGGKHCFVGFGYNQN